MLAGRKREGNLAKLWCLCLLLFVEFTSATVEYSIEKSITTESQSKQLHIIQNIRLIGSTQQTQRFINWLDEIATTTKGQDTLAAIIRSGHTLTIQHSIKARLSAGRTIAPMTENLINKKGESVTIIFDADMPDTGSHRVYNRRFELIEFTALQNLYHELAHAMHQMQGTWRYFASEDQAIEEENIFRAELVQKKQHKEEQNKQLVALRFGKDGEPINSSSKQKVLLSFNN